MKQQENKAVIVWRGAANTGLVSSADRAYMKTPSLVLRRTYRYTPVKIEMGGEAILGLSRLDYPLAKTGGTVNGGAFVRRSS